MNDIPKLFWASKKLQLNSYRGKHYLEGWRKNQQYSIVDEVQLSDPYIANGDFIIAMILCGFEYSFSICDQLGVNANFKAKLIKIAKDL